jgi:hypothetical protein
MSFFNDHEDELKKLSQEDVIDFFNSVIDHFKLNHDLSRADIIVNKAWMQGTNTDTMVKVIVDFQAFFYNEPHESTGLRLRFINHRAFSYSCKNLSIQERDVEEQPGVIIQEVAL